MGGPPIVMLTSASNENCPISTTTSQCHPNEGRISRRSGNVSAHTVIPANTARKRSCRCGSG